MDNLEAGLAAIDLSANPCGRTGCRTRINGLQSRPELNGRLGCIGEWKADRSRYAVTLDGCGTKILLRVDNLELADVVTAVLKDDRQPRDWPHRDGVDAPASFATLWTKPYRPGDAGAVRSPPCQCARPACTASTASCGRCIDDPVICWNCSRSFSLYCVGDGPDGLQRAGPIHLGDGDPESVLSAELDKKAKFKEWAKCPRCGVSLGASAMPTVFRTMLASTVFAQPGQSFSPQDAGCEFRALRTEQTYAFSQASEAASTDDAINNYTRAIRCANHIRCLSADLFDGDCRDTFLCAHARRAALEGDTTQCERIVAHFGQRGPSAVREYRFRDASHLGLSLLTLADIRDVFPGAQLTQMLGPGASAESVQQARQFGMSPIADDRTDWGYDRLSHDGRENNVWMFQARPSRLQPFQMWDFRWAFTSVAHAQDYFQVLLRVKSEEKTQVAAANLTRTTRGLTGLPHDAECLVLHNLDEKGGSPVPMASCNVLFRVGRLCAKVYVSCMLNDDDGRGRPVERQGGNAAAAGANAQRELAMEKCLALASRAAAKSWELAQAPHSESTERWESARARVVGAGSGR